MLVNKLGVDALLLMLCRLRFCKSFQSDTKRQIEANSNCPEHNGTDINRAVCVQGGILIAFQKLQRWYVGAVNMTQFSCYLYPQG